METVSATEKERIIRLMVIEMSLREERARDIVEAILSALEATGKASEFSAEEIESVVSEQIQRYSRADH